MTAEQIAAEYRCPGEKYPISRSVHLGRLASYYPPCRNCPHSSDASGLSRRQTRQVAEIGGRDRQPPLFAAEGVAKLPVDERGAALARTLAAEFTRQLGPTGNHLGDRAKMVVGGNGRPAAAAILAAIVEGARWTGSEVIEIGPASAPCLASAIEQLSADGGIYLGAADSGPQSVGLKFWSGCEPLSVGGLLEDLAANLPADPTNRLADRPSRRFGPLGHFAAKEGYLADFRPAYHALRPLRFVLDCPVDSFRGDLDELLRNVACRVIAPQPEIAPGKLAEQVLTARAHFGARIEDDGENCRVVDDRGQAVVAKELLNWMAGCFGWTAMESEGPRQRTFRSMRENGAPIAADAAGRLWYSIGRVSVPDALRTVTLLLVLLSRDDRALSEVLRGIGG